MKLRFATGTFVTRTPLARILLGGILCLALAQSAQCAAAKPKTGILFRTAKVSGTARRYEVYVPPEWTAKEKWPVILFLHGIGHRGEYPAQSQESVLARLFLRYGKPPRAIIVFPRCPADATWIEPKMEVYALAALRNSVRELRGDSWRLYLTGLSMGGYGTWYIASRNPGMFAAIVPICGGVRAPKTVPLPAVSTADDPFADVARRIGATPAWIFHGDADDTIDVAESRKMAAAMKAQGGEVRYTEYPGVGHNSWNRAYSDPNLMEWLLLKKLPAKK